MNKRYIGINFENKHVTAVQIVCCEQDIRIERVLRKKTNDLGEPTANAIGDILTEYAFDRQAAVAVDLDDNAVFFAAIKAGSKENAETQKNNRSNVDNVFPLPADSIITQTLRPGTSYAKDEPAVVAAAVKKDAFYETLNILKTAKIEPERMEAKIFAAVTTVTVNHPQSSTGSAIVAYISESNLNLAITRDGNVAFVRKIPFAAAASDDNIESLQKIAKSFLSEIEITWQKVFNENTNSDTQIYLIKADDVPDGLTGAIEQSTQCGINAVDPYAKVQVLEQHAGRFDICIAEGLAMGLMPDKKTASINFYEAEKSRVESTVNRKKEIVTFGALIAAIAIIAICGLFLRLASMESEYKKLNKKITDLFMRTLPEEKNIVNPAAQLDQKLQSLKTGSAMLLRESGTEMTTLQIFHAVTTSVPSQANIDSILIGADSVRVTGVCASFELIYNWQKQLEKNPAFENINIQDSSKDGQSRKISFTMSIELAKGGRLR